jgi:hypothetical protein
LTEHKQLSPAQLLDLVNVVEQHVNHIKPLLTMILNNPTVDLPQYLSYDKIAREKLTKMTRLLMAAASEKDFSTISFMLEDGDK